MDDIQETEYKSTAIVDSFSRGIQIPYSEFTKVAHSIKVAFKGDQDLICT
jgi:hypothetical protein